MVTFSFERGTAFVSELLGSMRLLTDLVEIARKTPLGAGGTAWDDAGIRRDLTLVAAELDAQWALTKRNVARAARHGSPGVGGSVFKLAYHETRERMGEVALAGARPGPPGPRRPPRAVGPPLDHVQQRLYALSLSIAAGHRPDPAQHRRRAPARPAQGAVSRGCVAAQPSGIGGEHRRPASRRGRAVDFELTDDQVALQDELRRFLADRVTLRGPPGRDRHARRGRPRPVARARRHGRVRPHAARGRRRRGARVGRGRDRVRGAGPGGRARAR